MCQAFKQEAVCCRGHAVGSDDRLVGPKNESCITIEGQPAVSLLDSGSQVSCVSETFYYKFLSHLELQSLNTLLKIEGAGGNTLPYLGFIEANISLPSHVLGKEKFLTSLFLVTPDTNYNQTCPVLIGTNIISVCLSFQIDDDWTRLPSAWRVAFKCTQMKISDDVQGRELHVPTPHEIPPQSSQMVICHHSGLIWDDRTPILVEASNPPSGLLITPAVYEQSLINEAVPVHMVNTTHKTITVPANTTLCHAFPVSIEQPVKDNIDPSPDIKALFPLEHLSTSLRYQVHQCLERHRLAFSWNDWDLGHCTAFKHRIKLDDETPFRHKYRRIPPAMVHEVQDHLQKMIDAGIIRKSDSPYSSPALFVRKSDSTIRFCCDFRTVNSRTIKDNHYLPIVDEAFDRLSGSKWFSTLDLKAGYWQLDMHPDDIKYTGFTAGCLGFYEWCRLPMGLKNSGATFQRMMETVMGSLNLQICLLYLDDVIAFSRDEQSHLQHLDIILTKIEDAGLKLKPSKCCLFQQEVKYLGHIISRDGIRTDPKKIDKVLDWPVPTNRKQLHRFLGFSGYYRRFVKNYAQIAGPLHELLKGEEKKKKGKAPSSKSSSAVPFVWGPPQQEAFSTLIKALTTTPVLAFAEFDKPFVVQVDASFSGLGAVLCQEHEGLMKPIAYASRKLTPSERRYPVHKLEFLALKWAISDKFHEYLYSSVFEVWTDNNPLTYVMKSAKVDATGLRWIADLSLYHFSIKYRPGKSNAAADALSRVEDGYLSVESVQAICNGSAADEFVSALAMSTEVVPDCQAVSYGEVTGKDWSALQKEDAVVGPVLLALMKSEQRLDSTLTDSRKLWNQRKRLVVDNDILYRTCKINDVTIKQLVLPCSERKEMLRLLHDEMGHFGRDRVVNLARNRFYWPGMVQDISVYIQECENCLKRKGKDPVAELVNMSSSQPMELVCMDFLCLETSSGGYSNILVLTDYFTRYAMAIPTRNQTAKTTAKALIDLFINHYGLPQRLHSDQGANFTGKVITEMCRMLGIKRSTTTGYHPMGNGQTEKMNRTLLDMLGTLPESKKSRWKDYVQPLVHAYNCTKCEVTGYSPFELMFGRVPRLPIDHQFGLLNEGEETSYNEYVEDLRKKLDDSYQVARKKVNLAHGRSKDRYDRKVRGNKLELGDRVLVRKTKFEEGRHKLANKWEDKVFVVDEKLDNIPVYKLRPEDGHGKCRRLHRNNILPISSKGVKPAADVSDTSSESSLEEIVVLDRVDEQREEIQEQNAEEERLEERPDEREELEEESARELEDEAEAVRETEGQAEAEQESATEEQNGEEETTIPRRSGRIRQPPARFRSGDYIMNNLTTGVDNQKFILLNRVLDLLK